MTDPHVTFIQPLRFTLQLLTERLLDSKTTYFWRDLDELFPKTYTFVGQEPLWTKLQSIEEVPVTATIEKYEVIKVT